MMEGRKEKVKALEKLVVEHVEDILTCPVGFQRETSEQQKMINTLAELMAAGRSVVEYDWVDRKGRLYANTKLNSLGGDRFNPHPRTGFG
ncbi:MAG: hypothetical protein R3B83_08970 [Nitrospirales bacterium]|nr:hypothetical protein [Nitrospirales bacterium]